VYAGQDIRGQRVRYLPRNENREAGGAWKGACFSSLTKKMTNKQIQDAFAVATNKKSTSGNLHNGKGKKTTTFIGVTVRERPEFSWSAWGQAGILLQTMDYDRIFAGQEEWRQQTQATSF
jgi:hypothetical protein